MKLTSIFTYSATALLLQGAALSQVIVSTALNGGLPAQAERYHVDTGTDVGTALFPGWAGSTNGDRGVAGMAADNVNGILYLSGNPTAYGGVKTLFAWPFNSPNDPQIILEDPVDLNGAAIDCSGLAFGNGKLYALSQYFAADGIYELDLATGIGTPVYLFVGSLDVGGLGYNPSDGLFYGTCDANGVIFAFDIVAQTETLVAAYPAGVSDVDGCCVDPAGFVYLVQDDPSPLYAYDLSTGTYVSNLTNPVVSPYTYSGGAWAPGLLDVTAVGTSYCFGDGLGTGCPCGNNNNGAESGCDWGDPAFPEGGVLDATGSDSMGANDTVLTATGVANNFGIFFGADNQVNGGNGNPLNDGLRCAGGGLIRLIAPTVASGNQATLPMPVQTLDSGAASGVTRRYQYWFRTPSGPCGQMANLTNGYEIVWLL